MGYTNNRNNANTYDAAGNQTNDGLHSYTFNAENQIVSMDAGTATGAGTAQDQALWAALDWTFINRWNLSPQQKQLFYGTKPGAIPQTFQQTVTGPTGSQVFTNGQLNDRDYNTLLGILTGNPNSSACNGLLEAFAVSEAVIAADKGFMGIPDPVPGALQFGSNGYKPTVGPAVTQTSVATINDRGNTWTFMG